MIYVTDAARWLGVSDQTIRNWAEKGVLTIKKMGRAHYVDGDLMSFYTKGDSAPYGRLNWIYGS